MSRILVAEFERLITSIEDGTATPGDIARANLLMEFLGVDHRVLYANCKPFLKDAIQEIKVPELYHKRFFKSPKEVMKNIVDTYNE